MILGIDATNIRVGGGLTHLREILQNAEPESHDFEKVIVWSNKETLSQLPDLPWLRKKTAGWLNLSFIFSFVYQVIFLSRQVKNENCDLLFVPGGTFLGDFKNTVAMSQNMLPFEVAERSRFTDWKSKLRFQMLYYTQSLTFKKSKGVIFLTNYAKTYITEAISLKQMSTVIPHGINLSFLQKPKPQKEIVKYSFDNPFRLLYVSIVTAYKHQWNVAEAVIKLNTEGYPITLSLVGNSTPESHHHLQKVLARDIEGCVTYDGHQPHEKLAETYKNADAFVFASSCENMPIILVEAMTAGLPIICSEMGPMPEVLGDAGFYFNPLDTEDIYFTLKKMLDSPQLRSKNAESSYNKSINYTWKDCAAKTFKYLSQTAKSLRNENTK